MASQGLLAAYVLHTRRYGDTSLLVELLTREQGRVACIAKGALRNRTRNTVAQPFQPLLVGLRGRGEIQTLSSIENSSPPLPLIGRRLYCGLYLNELLLKLTARDDPCVELFDDYAESLRHLGSEAQEEPVLRRFEIRLLQRLGHGLTLEQDSDGQPISFTQRYTYTTNNGLSATSVDTPGSIAGATLQALASGELNNAELLREARLFMRSILNHHLDGRPLRSRELFR